MKETLTDKDLKRFKKNQKIANDTSIPQFNYDNMTAIVDRLEDGKHDNLELLETCRRFWDSGKGFRDRAYRAWRYRRGDQWGDIINDPDHAGKRIVEEDYILRQGKPAFKQNIISQLIRSITGQYITNPSKSAVIATIRENQVISEMLTNALQTCLNLNKSERLDADNLQQYISSGSAISKVTWSWWEDKMRYDGKIQNVSPFNFGFNTDVADPRLFDLWLLFELHDMRIEDVKLKFAKTKDQEEVIENLYSITSGDVRMPNQGLNSERYKNTDFYLPKDTTLCRVIEVWEKRQGWRTRVWDPTDASFEIWDGDPRANANKISEINNQRRKQANDAGIEINSSLFLKYTESLETFWYVRYLTPYGECLFESESTFEHKSHPYCLELAMLNGEVWGLVEELIDQQRMINRSMILFDFIISASAKGVLLVPEDCVPDDMNISDFAEEWTKFNGVIKFKPNKSGSLPQQISANSTNIGLNEFISMQMNLIQQIAGVSPAMQGQEAKSGTPAQLYAESAMNASNNIKDLLKRYGEHIKDRDSKLLKVLLQYYETGRYIDVNGTSQSEEAKIFNKEMVKNIDFDLKVSSSPETPAYRMLVEDSLKELFDKQIIDATMYLETSALPFSDSLLQKIKMRQKQQAEAQAGQTQDIPTDSALAGQIINEGVGGANPNPQQQAVMDKLTQMQ